MLCKATLLSATFLAQATSAFIPDTDLEERLERIVSVHARQARGVAVTISAGESLSFEGAVGRIHFGGNEPASASAALPGAMLIDFLTALTAMRLVEDGRMELDAEVELPGLVLEGEVISLRQLLQHTSGLPSPATTFDTARSTWAPLVSEGLSHDPGACQVFSSGNTWALGGVIEQVTGMALQDAIRTMIIEPADLEGTGWIPGARDELDEAGTWIDCGGEVFEDPTATLRFDTGDLVTTTSDVARLMMAFADGKIVGDVARARMTGNLMLEDGSELNYGYGLNRTSLNDFQGFSISGTNGHEKIHVAWYPMLETVVSIGADTSEPDIAALQRRLVREIYDMPGPAWEYRELPDRANEIYPGVYRIGCNRLEVLDSEDGFRLVGASFPEIRMLYVGGNTFVGKDDGESVMRFQLGDDGVAYSMTLDVDGSQVVAVRVER